MSVRISRLEPVISLFVETDLLRGSSADFLTASPHFLRNWQDGEALPVQSEGCFGSGTSDLARSRSHLHYWLVAGHLRVASCRNTALTFLVCLITAEPTASALGSQK